MVKLKFTTSIYTQICEIFFLPELTLIQVAKFKCVCSTFTSTNINQILPNCNYVISNMMYAIFYQYIIIYFCTYQYPIITWDVYIYIYMCCRLFHIYVFSVNIFERRSPVSTDK